MSRPRFSPDGKWVVFLLSKNSTSTDVVLAPYRGAAPIPEEDWVTVTPSPADIEQAFWSPNSELIYFVASVGGNYALMARHLDAGHRPAGDPFRVFQFTDRVHPEPFNATHPTDALTAVPGGFIGAMPEFSYNVWIMDLPK